MRPVLVLVNVVKDVLCTMCMYVCGGCFVGGTCVCVYMFGKASNV